VILKNDGIRKVITPANVLPSSTTAG